MEELSRENGMNRSSMMGGGLQSKAPCKAPYD